MRAVFPRLLPHLLLIKRTDEKNERTGESGTLLTEGGNWGKKPQLKRPRLDRVFHKKGRDYLAKDNRTAARNQWHDDRRSSEDWVNGGSTKKPWARLLVFAARRHN